MLINFIRCKFNLLCLHLIIKEKRMNLNDQRQSIIGFAMYKNKVSKKTLAKALGLSYPTMLSKLKDTGSMKLSEADALILTSV